MRKFVCLLILLCSFLFAETIPVADANVEGARVEMEGGLAELDGDSLEYIDDKFVEELDGYDTMLFDFSDGYENFEQWAECNLI